MLMLETLELNKTKRRPVWIMRQAGRYLASYRKLRESYTFDDFSNNAALATEVTLLPFKQYDLDAAVVFSDILIPLKATGASLEFTDKGPVLGAPQSVADLKKLRQEFDPMIHTPTIMQTITNVRSTLNQDIAVLGFAGAPFTMLAYLLEGKLTKDLSVIKTWMATEPELVKSWLSFLAESTGRYLDAQAEAGANAVQLFDTWASVLSREDYEEFALPYAREVISEVTVPCIYYVNGVQHLLQQAAATGAQALSVDWRTPLSVARSQLSHVVALQGNLDPYHLKKPKAELRKKVFEMCSDYGDAPGHIVNLGHGIVPSIPEDAVKHFIEFVHEWSASSL